MIEVPEVTLALTIRQPWLWAMVALGKRLENRSWLPTQVHTQGEKASQWFALHSGGQYDLPGERYLVDHHVPSVEQHHGEMIRSAIVAIAKIRYPIWKPGAEPAFDVPVVGVTWGGFQYGKRLTRGQLAGQLPWFRGPYAWPLVIEWLDVPIENVRGAQRFWRLRSVDRVAIELRLRRARRKRKGGP